MATALPYEVSVLVGETVVEGDGAGGHKSAAFGARAEEHAYLIRWFPRASAQLAMRS